jgi:hypothetical protein
LEYPSGRAIALKTQLKKYKFKHLKTIRYRKTDQYKTILTFKFKRKKSLIT